MKAYYDKHPDRFKQPDLVSVRHILVTVKQGEGKQGLSEVEAKARIAKIQAELKKGAKFEALAKKYSDDPGSKENGGLYADADPSGWVPEFGAAARTQPVGKVGAPVKTTYGYHLIKVESRKPSRQVPFEEAKGPCREDGSAGTPGDGMERADGWPPQGDPLRADQARSRAKDPGACQVTGGPKGSRTRQGPEASKAPVTTKGGAE